MRSIRVGPSAEGPDPGRERGVRGMVRLAGVVAVTVAVSLGQSVAPARALPVTTDGLIVTTAAVEVQSVTTPATWVPTTAVHEGSPARLVLGVDAPGSGTVQVSAELPGPDRVVGSASTSVSPGASTLRIPLDLSYGGWLSGATANPVDRLDVRVSFTPTPPGRSPGPPILSESDSASPSPPQATTPSMPSTAASLESSPPVTGQSTQPERIRITDPQAIDRRSIRAAIDTLPREATVLVVVRLAKDGLIRPAQARSIARTIARMVRATGRPVVTRVESAASGRRTHVDIVAARGPRMRSTSITSTSAFAVPLTVAPRPVMFVHGMWSDASIWSAYTQSGNFLAGAHPAWRGYAVDTMNTGTPWLPYASVNTIADNAALAWTYVREKMSMLNAHEVDLVGHSLGGVIIRRMLHDPAHAAAAQAAVRSVVLIGTPNGGSSCSDAWVVPANRELTFTAMNAFNLAYPGYPGAFTTSLYSDGVNSTCFDSSTGDFFVPAWSTQAQSVHAVRRITPAVLHWNQPSDAGLFTNDLKPTLALASAPVDSGPTPQLTNPNAPSTRVAEGTANGISLSATQTVTVEQGRTIVVNVVAPDGATGTVSYPGGSGAASVPLAQEGDYPILKAELSYAALGGTGSPLVIPLTIDSTASASTDWIWAITTRS